MRRKSMSDLIKLSFMRTVLVLFKPFSWKKWVYLVLIAFLAGALGSGSNFSGPGGTRRKEKDKQPQVTINANNLQASLAFYHQKKDLSFNLLDRGYQEEKRGYLDYVNLFTVGIFIFLVVPLIIFFLWLGSRFKFIWFDSIVKNDASLVEPFKRYKKEGNSLFKFFLLVSFLSLSFFGLIAYWMFFIHQKLSGLYGSEGAWPFMRTASVFLVPGLLMLIAVIFLIFLNLVVNHFLVPIMALDNSSLRQAWGKFIAIYRSSCRELWFYFLVFIGLYFLGGIIALLLALGLFLILGLAAAILFGLPYLLLGVLLNVMPVFIIYAIIVGIFFVILSIILFWGIDLPFAVFFRSFSLYFLSSLESDYNPLEIQYG